MKKSTVLFLIAVLSLLLGGVAQAASPWAAETTYKGKVIGKLDYGFKNTLGGWTEIFTETSEGDPNCKCQIAGAAKGLGRGLVYGVADTVGGLLHLITFPFPQIDVPLPEGGVTLT